MDFAPELSRIDSREADTIEMTPGHGKTTGTLLLAVVVAAAAWVVVMLVTLSAAFVSTIDASGPSEAFARHWKILFGLAVLSVVPTLLFAVDALAGRRRARVWGGVLAANYLVWLIWAISEPAR